MSDKQLSTHAAAAAAIRKELKAKFPLVTFKVTSQCFSMGNSVHVSWVDGPLDKEVDAIINQYQYGDFNGMEDIYEITNRRNDIPQVKYVQSRRDMSEATKALIAANILHQCALRDQEGNPITDLSEDVWVDNWQCYSGTLIYRVFAGSLDIKLKLLSLAEIEALKAVTPVEADEAAVAAQARSIATAQVALSAKRHEKGQRVIVTIEGKTAKGTLLQGLNERDLTYLVYLDDTTEFAEHQHDIGVLYANYYEVGALLPMTDDQRTLALDTACKKIIAGADLRKPKEPKEPAPDLPPELAKLEAAAALIIQAMAKVSEMVQGVSEALALVTNTDEFKALVKHVQDQKRRGS
jgi:hypothetical protein